MVILDPQHKKILISLVEKTHKQIHGTCKVDVYCYARNCLQVLAQDSFIAASDAANAQIKKWKDRAIDAEMKLDKIEGINIRDDDL